MVEIKNKIKREWFISKMRLYKKFKLEIDNCIVIGKTLGDAFVWHFYQFNLKDLFKHIEHESIRIPPIGIGGLGELEFIKKYFFINNHIAILHGISNFLKVGDVSFISMKDFQLSSIGEIKTKKIDEERVNINVTSINAEGRFFLRDDEVQVVNLKENEIYKQYFDPDRFKRQIERMKNIVRPLETKPNRGKEKFLFDKYNVKELEEVVIGTKNEFLKIMQAGSDLLYVAARAKNKIFSKRINDKEDDSKFQEKKGEIEQHIISILDKENPNFHMQFGSVHFDKHFKPINMIGTAPIFWYPIKPEVLKEIYFQNVFVTTVFNPTQFFNGLREMGIEFVKDAVSGKFSLQKNIGDAKMRFEYFNYFLLLIKEHLHTRQAVISVIKEIILAAEENGEITKPLKMQTEILQLFTAYNQDSI